MLNTNFYLAITAFSLSILGGLYFLTLWLKGGERFLLWWSIGLASLLLFKVPNILINAGFKIVQQDWYPFFFVTLSIYFFAYFALAKGLAILTGHYHQRLQRGFIILLTVSVVYFGLSFLAHLQDSLPVWISHILFFIPAQILFLNELWHTRNSPSAPRMGYILVTVGVFSLLASSVMYIMVQAFNSNARFLWYLSVISSSGISAVQIFSCVFLLLGFSSIARHAGKDGGLV